MLWRGKLTIVSWCYPNLWVLRLYLHARCDGQQSWMPRNFTVVLLPA